MATQIRKIEKTCKTRKTTEAKRTICNFIFKMENVLYLVTVH